VLGVHFHEYPPEGTPIGWVAAAWRNVGPTGVDLFFVLSGFLIGSLLFTELEKYSRIGIGRFLVRRGFKIYPIYYLFLAYCIVVPVAKAWSHGGAAGVFGGRLHDLLSSLFFAQNYLPPNPNVHTWSLAVEEHFYIVLPLLLLLLGHKRVWKWMIPICLGAIPLCLATRGVAIACYQSDAIASAAGPWEGFKTHFRVDALLLGVALAVLSVKFPNRFLALGRFPRVLIAVGVGLWALVCLPHWPLFFFGTLGITLKIIGSAALVLGVCNLKGGSGKRGLIAWIGTTSYATYVWHVTVIGITESWVPAATKNYASYQGLRWVLLASIACVSCIAAGALVTNFIEKPILALRDRWFPSRGRAVSLPKSGIGPVLADGLQVSSPAAVAEQGALIGALDASSGAPGLGNSCQGAVPGSSRVET
jgi:peptidoglycan/LPS O-acetylase OafA/YrhL